MPVKIEKTELGRRVDKVLKNLIANKRVGKVGWLNGAKYPDGAPVAMVAEVQEKGHVKLGIPPRPFFRPAIRENQNEWKELALREAKKVVREGTDPINVIEVVALKAAAQIRRQITQLQSPQLAPATIRARERKRALGKGRAAKGLEKPLIDSGIMLNALTYKIEQE